MREREENLGRENITQTQRMYSEIFLYSSYPKLLFPHDERFSDPPEVFSQKLEAWKAKEISRLVGGNIQILHQSLLLKYLTLANISRTAHENLTDSEFALNSRDENYPVGDDMDALLKEINYWNWALEKSTSGQENFS